MKLAKRMITMFVAVMLVFSTTFAQAAVNTEKQQALQKVQEKLKNDGWSGYEVQSDENQVIITIPFSALSNVQLPSEQAANDTAVADPSAHVQVLMAEEDYVQAQAYMLENPFEGMEEMLAECNDVCFLLDLAKALEARWADIGQDTSIMSDKKVREYYASLVESELQHVGKYANLSFTDEVLAEYAYTYLAALQNQAIGAEKYGKEPAVFQEYWTANGSDVRTHMLYLINKGYGIELSSKYQSTLKDSIQLGRTLDYKNAVERCISRQLYELDLKMQGTSYGWAQAKNYPFELKNNTDYSIGGLNIEIFFLDEEGYSVYSVQVLGYEDLAPWVNYTVNFNQPGSGEAFANYKFCYSYWDENFTEYQATVYPRTQYSWDGKTILCNGINDSEATFSVDDVSFEWKTQKGKNGLLVPSVDLTVLNTSEVNADEVVLSCVFINAETNTVWDEQKVYLCTSSTAPLKAGYGKLASVYSDTGYTSKPDSLPEMTVEFYVNGEPIGQISSKP